MASSSVERVVEYLDLPQEPPGIIADSRPPPQWPSYSGPNRDALIVVEDLEVRYAPDLPAVLQNVSFRLAAQGRIGLLGRTGSGKSTLAMSLLRFVDPSKGRVIIDGIDITTIGVQDLRSRLVSLIVYMIPWHRSLLLRSDVYSARCGTVLRQRKR
jgi:ABC-type multidrug transport system fused ATPase/permease subunit